MKGHVLIADNAARQIADKKQVYAVFAEDRSKQMWRKTRADILADLACLRPGDRIFFYDIQDIAFWGIYEVTSRLFLGEGDIGFSRPAPYRFCLRPFLPLEKPVSENALFTRKDAARDFRSIFYKKVLNRGKACTHLFPDETAALTEMLLMQNDNIPEEAAVCQPAEAPVPILPKFDRNGVAVSLEKELEWWLTHHLDSHRECRKIFGDPADIEMFANYIPITISGGNIDIVVYHRANAAGADVRNKISVVELKKDGAKADAIREMENYVRWFVYNIVGAEQSAIIQPILIATGFNDDVLTRCKHWNLSERKPRLFCYKAISDDDIRFEEVRYD